MKKFCFLLLISLFIAGIPRIIANADTLKPTKEFYVNDYADVISVEVEDEIIDLGYQLEEQTGAQIVLVTVDFTNGDSLETYAMDLFNDWGIGSAEKNDGLLILLSIGDDDYWVTQGEGLEDTLTSGKISSILQKYLEPDFAAKDYSAGAKKTYEAFAKRLNSQSGNATASSESGEIKKADKYTYDHAKIISSEYEEYINYKSTEMKEKYNAGFYVITRDYCEDGLSFQEDTIKTFERLKAKGRDVVLVLYKEDDNYWLLPGRETEVFATNNVLGDILDNVLEPEFAEKHYSQGAMDTANSFYRLFQSNYEDLTKIEPEVVNSGSNTGNNTGSDADVKADNFRESNNSLGTTENNPVVYGMITVLILLFIISIKSGRRKSFMNHYGVPFNPYSRKYIRIYGPGGYWGPHGYPHGGTHNGGYHNSGYQNSGRQYNSDDDDDNRGRGRASTGGSFWGSNGGAGRSSSTRSSSSSGSSSSSSYSGGGAGRSSGGHSSSSGHSSGGGRASSSGGGGRSRGGGAGRNR